VLSVTSSRDVIFAFLCGKISFDHRPLFCFLHLLFPSFYGSAQSHRTHTVSPCIQPYFPLTEYHLRPSSSDPLIIYSHTPSHILHTHTHTHRGSEGSHRAGHRHFHPAPPRCQGGGVPLLPLFRRHGTRGRKGPGSLNTIPFSAVIYNTI
jgi:hypothetical protein